MANPRSNGSYSYDGRLVFNGLYSTKILGPDFDLETTVEDGLKDFTRGTNEEPGSGYHMLDFAERVSDSPDISRQIKSESEDIYGIRYRYEQWNEREVESESGDGTEYRNVRTTDSVDVYWDFSNYLVIKGNKTEPRQAGSLIESILGDYIRTREIGFASDFLLWILSQYKNGEELGDEDRGWRVEGSGVTMAVGAARNTAIETATASVLVREPAREPALRLRHRPEPALLPHHLYVGGRLVGVGLVSARHRDAKEQVLFAVRTTTNQLREQRRAFPTALSLIGRFWIVLVTHHQSVGVRSLKNHDQCDEQDTNTKAQGPV